MNVEEKVKDEELDDLASEEVRDNPIIELDQFKVRAQELGIVDGIKYDSPLGNSFVISVEHWTMDMSGNIIQMNVGATLANGSKIGEFVYLGRSKMFGKFKKPKK